MEIILWAFLCFNKFFFHHKWNEVKIFAKLTFLFWILLFFSCYLAAPWRSLGHSSGNSFINPMLNTAIYIFQHKGHQKPRNELGSPSPVELLVEFETETSQFQSQCLNPCQVTLPSLYSPCYVIYSICHCSLLVVFLGVFCSSAVPSLFSCSAILWYSDCSTCVLFFHQCSAVLPVLHLMQFHVAGFRLYMPKTKHHGNST